MTVLPMLKFNSLPSICSSSCKKVTQCHAQTTYWWRFHGLIGGFTYSSILFLIGQRHSYKFQCAKDTKKHLAFCQSCQYFINLQLRQSITKHFTNHSKTTISCPTPGLEIIQHASQRPREVCKQPGIKTGVARRTHTVCVSYRNRMERNQRCSMLELAVISQQHLK